jgi:hypothetical protein
VQMESEAARDDDVAATRRLITHMVRSLTVKKSIKGTFITITFINKTLKMTGIPPGISFIFSQLPSVLLPIGGTYAIIIFTRQHLHLNYPSWLDVVVTLALQPVFFIVKRGLATFAKRRVTISMGAVTPPQVPGNSFQIVKTIMASFRDGYIGSCLI